MREDGEGDREQDRERGGHREREGIFKEAIAIEGMCLSSALEKKNNCWKWPQGEHCRDKQHDKAKRTYREKKDQL